MLSRPMIPESGLFTAVSARTLATRGRDRTAARALDVRLGVSGAVTAGTANTPAGTLVEVDSVVVARLSLTAAVFV